MELALAIQYIYPNIIRGTDFEVLDDNQGKGQYIKWFNKDIIQPTQAELKTAWDKVLILQQAENNKLIKKEAINKIATLSDQLNLIATVLDIITEGSTDPVVINAKVKFNEIKEILTK